MSKRACVINEHGQNYWINRKFEKIKLRNMDERYLMNCIALLETAIDPDLKSLNLLRAALLNLQHIKSTKMGKVLYV